VLDDAIKPEATSMYPTIMSRHTRARRGEERRHDTARRLSEEPSHFGATSGYALSRERASGGHGSRRDAARAGRLRCNRIKASAGDTAVKFGASLISIPEPIRSTG